MRLGFHHDTQRCTGCRTCVMACRNDHHLEPGLQWREVYAYREDPEDPRRYYLSVACNHCRQPECVRVCPVGVAYRRPDGIVARNHDLCRGCRLCVLACPYGAIRYSARERKASKCDFCADRLAQGRLPACVEACPTQALRVIDLDTCTEPSVTPHVPGFPSAPFTDPSVCFTVPSPGPGRRK